MSADIALLHESVLAQAELGGFDIYFDEPWAPAKKSPAAFAPPPSPPRAAVTPPPASAPAAASRPSAAPAPPVAAPAAAPAPSSVSTTAEPVVSLAALMSSTPAQAPDAESSAWERAKNTADFHQCLATHPLYQELCGGQLVAGSGPVGAPFMLVFHSPSPVDLMEQAVLSGAPGELLTNLLKSVNVLRPDCYSTYFFKGNAPARLLPRQLAQLRKMLQAEVRLVRPATILFFGERTYQQVLEGKTPFLQEAGNPVEFADRPATALIDPADMLDNKELKLLTWKNHIPRCGFFKR